MLLIASIRALDAVNRSVAPRKRRPARLIKAFLFAVFRSLAVRGAFTGATDAGHWAMNIVIHPNDDRARRHDLA